MCDANGVVVCEYIDVVVALCTGIVVADDSFVPATRMDSELLVVVVVVVILI